MHHMANYLPGACKCCHQQGWLKQKLLSHSSETRNLKSRCQQGWDFSLVLWGPSPSFLMTPHPHPSLTCLSGHITSISTVLSHDAFLCICYFRPHLSLLMKTPVILDIGPTLILYDFVLTSVYIYKDSPSKVIFIVLNRHELLRDSTQLKDIMRYQLQRW